MAALTLQKGNTDHFETMADNDEQVKSRCRRRTRGCSVRERLLQTKRDAVGMVVCHHHGQAGGFSDGPTDKADGCTSARQDNPAIVNVAAQFRRYLTEQVDHHCGNSRYVFLYDRMQVANGDTDRCGKPGGQIAPLDPDLDTGVHALMQHSDEVPLGLLCCASADQELVPEMEKV